MPAEILETILDAVGNTPLVRLSRLASDTRTQVVAKVESLNPGGSVKDRIGLAMIEAAEQAGQLRPGRDDRRADLGQHRHGPGHRRRAQGLPPGVRHARQDVERKDRPAARVRRRRRGVPDRRAAREPAELLQRRRATGARDPGRVPAQPVLQSGQPGRPRGDHRARDLASDRRPASPTSSAGMGTGGTITGVGRVLKRHNPSRAGGRRRPGRLDLLGRRQLHAQDLQGRGHRRGLHAQHDGPERGRPHRGRRRQGELSHGAPADARRGHPGRRLGRLGAGRRACAWPSEIDDPAGAGRGAAARTPAATT